MWEGRGEQPIEAGKTADSRSIMKLMVTFPSQAGSRAMVPKHSLLFLDCVQDPHSWSRVTHR